MRIYWFWPYVHADQLVLPSAVARTGDHLVLHAITDRVRAEEAGDIDGSRLEIEATLAAPADTRERSVRWLASRATTYLRRVGQRRALLRRGGFDVCHVVFSNYFTDAFDFRRIARRTALVFEVHDVVPHQSRVPRFVERRLLALLYSAPGRIVVRHEFVRDRLVQEFGVERERVAVIPWHVPVVTDDAHTSLDEHPCVLFFGTLRRNKGVDVFLRAIARLPHLDNVSFVFAGRGFPDVEQLITDAASKDPRIRFAPGYVPTERKHELYAAADLVVLPYTEFASASAVLCDAYAYNVPVVVTDVGALGASVRADDTGWVVRPSDPTALAAAIETAVTEVEAWRAASENARRAAAERTPERTAAKLRALYDDIVE